MLLLGILTGYLIFKQQTSQKLQDLAMASELAAAAGIIKHGGYQASPQRGSVRELADLEELPPPRSRDAEMMLNTTRVWTQPLLELYTFFTDAVDITELDTVVFLRQLLQSLSDSNDDKVAAFANDTSSLLSPEVVEVFIGVARDILSYFRQRRSSALLLLLREISVSGGISLSDVDPDVLQRELNEVMNLTALNQWYGLVGQFDTHASFETRLSRTRAAQESNAAKLLTDSQMKGRRMLQAAGRLWHRQHPAATRQLHGIASIPAISGDQALAEDTLPTISPPLTLRDMICMVENFSPVGVKGLSLPAEYSNSSYNHSIKGKEGPVTCGEPLSVVPFRHAGVAFKRVVIPVVFHCQRFPVEGTLHPPIWEPEKAAQNLIDVTNKLFKDTLIQFKLQEVRSDPKQFPYLMLASMTDWQSCTGKLQRGSAGGLGRKGVVEYSIANTPCRAPAEAISWVNVDLAGECNPDQEGAGFPCLKDTAKFPEVAALAEQHVINIIVGGSQSPLYCNWTDSEICSSLYLGYSTALGPWFTEASPTWQEGLSEENFIFVTWDMFSPSVKNALRFWDGGAVTLAHELGHYLGLMHTHAGPQCEGDGLRKADAVPDTPVNMQTVQWAASKGLAVELATWCSSFRNGKAPSTETLLKFKTCTQDPLMIDNVFNLLSYLPDSCSVVLTPNQIARLQWATSTFRPKLMAAFAA
eukprot:gene7450-7660_t